MSDRPDEPKKADGTRQRRETLVGKVRKEVQQADKLIRDKDVVKKRPGRPR